MAKMGAALPVGFDDPVADSRAVFRIVLTALSRPGTTLACPCRCAAPAPFLPAAGAIGLALLDGDTPTWLDDELNTEPVRTFLRFHAGVPIATDPARAAYAFVACPAAMPPLDRFAAGSSLAPEQSTTIVVQVPSLRDGAAVTLEGPGIETTTSVRPVGLPPWFWSAWDRNHAGFPCGVDLVLTDGRDLVGLPRTTSRR